MAYQLSQLVTDVRNKLDDSSFSSTLITAFLNDSQRYIVNKYHFKFMEGKHDQTLTIDDNEYDLQSDVEVVETLRITAPSGEEVDLTGNYMTYIEFDNKYPDPQEQESGKPHSWTIRNDDLILFPKPDAAYVLTLRYQKKPTTLSADADVPNIPERHQELLVLGALARCHKFNDNYDLAAFEEAELEKQLTDTVAKTYLRQGGRPRVMRVNGRRA